MSPGPPGGTLCPTTRVGRHQPPFPAPPRTRTSRGYCRCCCRYDSCRYCCSGRSYRSGRRRRLRPRRPPHSLGPVWSGRMKCARTRCAPTRAPARRWRRRPSSRCRPLPARECSGVYRLPRSDPHPHCPHPHPRHHHHNHHHHRHRSPSRRIRSTALRETPDQSVLRDPRWPSG